MKLSQLWRYPLKSGRPEALDACWIEARGLSRDRRWMVIDADGAFMTARAYPKLLQIIATPGEGGQISLSRQGAPTVQCAPNPGAGFVSTQVWGADCDGLPMDEAANRWLSEHLGQPCRLVYMPDEVRRSVEADVAQPEDIVSFADGFPLLLANQGSLNDLNSRIEAPLQMLSFRPNLTVDGAPPFAELTWARIKIGDLEFVSGGPCVRCKLTTLDPMTGDRRSDGEPLKTLATYQRVDGGTIFGVNMIPRGEGHLELGARVTVLETH